jgi:hypothetical protein
MVLDKTLHGAAPGVGGDGYFLTKVTPGAALFPLGTAAWLGTEKRNHTYPESNSVFAAYASLDEP